ncbi:MAG: hypothetical protein ABI253_08085 [Mycobacterium sp.]
MKTKAARIVIIALALALAGASPVANAVPQQCDETVGESVDSYLTRHPDIKRDLAERGQQEDPGAPNPVLAYLERHPNVRQALITLSQQCA